MTGGHNGEVSLHLSLYRVLPYQALWLAGIMGKCLYIRDINFGQYKSWPVRSLFHLHLDEPALQP